MFKLGFIKLTILSASILMTGKSFAVSSVEYRAIGTIMSVTPSGSSCSCPYSGCAGGVSGLIMSKSDLNRAYKFLVTKYSDPILMMADAINSKNRENTQVISDSIGNASKSKTSINNQIEKDTIRVQRKIEADDHFVSGLGLKDKDVAESIELGEAKTLIKREKSALIKAVDSVMNNKKQSFLKMKNQLDMLKDTGESIEEYGLSHLIEDFDSEKRKAAIVKRVASIFNPEQLRVLTENEEKSIGKLYYAKKREKDDVLKAFYFPIIKNIANNEPLIDPELFIDDIPKTEEFDYIFQKIKEGVLLSYKDWLKIQTAQFTTSPDFMAKEESGKKESDLNRTSNKMLSFIIGVQRNVILESFESIALMKALSSSSVMLNQYDSRMKSLHPDSKGMN